MDTVIKKTGEKPGKTLAIFGGIHGNEKVGILTVEKLMRSLEIEAGTVYLVLANPLAIEKNMRMVNKNLNRLFSRSNTGDAPEDIRARELMDLLDTCDALLDIHSYNSPTGDQFAISEPRGFEILKKMDFPIVASGFNSLGDGTDGYMERSGKVGICIECGTSNRYEQFLDLAEQSTYQFLQHYGAISAKVAESNTAQKHFFVKKIIYKETDEFRFSREYRDFELLQAGEVYISDGAAARVAQEGEAIIFPRPDVPVGGEVCIIGEFR